MFAPSIEFRRNAFVDVCIPSNEELFFRYGQSLASKGTNDGSNFEESESSMSGLSKPELIMKARKLAQSYASQEE